MNFFDIINGRHNFIDIRKKCIFIGIENKDYKLHPSAIRENGIELNKFISNNELKLFNGMSANWGIIPIVIIIFVMSCYLSIMVVFAFFSISYSENNIRFPHGYSTSLKMDKIMTYQID